MSTARWSRLSLSVAPAQPKVRWSRASLNGDAPATAKVRWSRLSMSGTAAVVVNALTDQTVEPESTVTIAASLVGGGSADSWTFRPISGPAIGITGTGATRTFRAPSAMPPSGATVVVGVRATKDGTLSPEVTCTITVLPQVSWVWDGSKFVGARNEYVDA